MATSKEVRAVHERDAEPIGLLAQGCSGAWEIQIDETTAGPDRWFAQIEGPSVELYFEILSPDLIEKTIQFLANQPTSRKGTSPQKPLRNGTLVLGKDRKTAVALVRDDEFSDRYFLVIGQAARPVVRFTLAGTDLKDLTAALRQAQEDLNEN
jgi:hypothetical protein